MRFVHLGGGPKGISQGGDYPVMDWDHKLSVDIGLYDRCSFSIRGTLLELEELFDHGLCTNIERYTPDGNKLIWQGYIDEMVLTQPGMRSRISLEHMYNRIRVFYTALNTGTNPPGETPNSITSAANDTTSQAKYGIKEKVFRPPLEKMTATMATQLRDTLLEQYRQPRRSDDATMSDQDLELRIFGKGYIHTLGWRVYTHTATSGTDQSEDQIYIIVDDVGDFITNQIYVYRANGTLVPRYYNDQETALQIIQQITSVGDSNFDEWIAYVDDNRVFHYEEASNSIGYWRRMSDRQLAVRDMSGRAIPPWEVRPNRWLETTDVASYYSPSSSDLADDPRCIYIKTVEWYEDSNNMVLTGSKGEQIDVILARIASQGESL